MTKIPNCLVNCFEHLYFRHYNLFRISDFGFLILVVLGVLCALSAEFILTKEGLRTGFARVIVYPIP